nr:hypothetical protein BaRGS_026461 [Batillaria attramentaria]
MVSYPLFDIPNHIIVDTVEYVTWINRVFTWYVAPVVEDCEDGSDEAFCVHGETCDGFTCNNGESDYCLPVYVRCNGVYDCPGHEDEMDFLAGVPLLPVTSHWKFYSQTGICIPLPITRKAFGGRDYSFGVMIVFNFVLFLLIAAGQAIIFWSVRRNTLSVETTRKSQDLTIARRLITVAVSDFLCWFPIGLLGLMAGAGVPVPSDFNVVTAIFVLPLNSALNPFLYTYNLLVEKRRKVREGRLLKLLESQLTLEDSSVS